MTSSSGARRPVRVVSDVRLADGGARFERGVLVALFVLLYMAYGALGRDVFYNHLMFGRGVTVVDPIGAVLPYVRITLCLVAILLVVALTDLNWAFSKVPWLLAPFLLLALLSVRWSDNPKDVIRNVVMTATMWLALPMLIHRLGFATSTRITLHVIAAVCIASCFLALAFPNIGRHSGLEAVQQSHVGEWRGIFSHKNSLGPWAAWGSVFLFTHSSVCGGPRLYWWVARASAVACLVFCHSATSVVACAAVWLLWIGFMLLRRLSLGAFLLAVLLPIGLCATVAAIFSSDLLLVLGRDDTFTGRTLIWALDAEFFWQRPWFGYGFEMLGGAAFNDHLFNMTGQVLSPESAYWSMLLDLGVVGFALFLIPLLIAIRNGFEWMKHVVLVDRAFMEMQILLIFSIMIIALTEAQILLSTGFDGVITFTALFALLTVPKSPEGVLRGEFRLAKHRIDPRRRKQRMPAARASKAYAPPGRQDRPRLRPSNAP